MSTRAFVGRDRVRLVDALLDRYREVRRSGESRVCALVAPTGWGKTRVVQEVYAGLVRMHADDYWPPSLVDGEGSWLEARKRIFPPPFDVPAGTPIPFLWLGLSCDRDQMGQELAALQYAERQFEAHVGPLAELLSSKSDSWKSRLGAVGAMTGLFGLPDPVNLALTWHGVATSGWDVLTGEWRAFSHRRTSSQSRSIDTYGRDREKDGARELAENLARISGEDLPIVVVVDDAHWADAGTVSFVSRLLATSGRVLVLATGWPDRLALQESEPGSFGAELVTWIEAGLADRLDLGQLPTEAVESLILDGAPRTEASVVRALVRRADGNPNHLLGLLSLRVVQRSLVDGAFQLAPADLDGLPAGDREIYQRIWRDLPDSVRDVLALSTVQGRQFNPDWVPIAADLLRLTDVDRGLGESRSPWGWIRSVDQALDAFVEAGLFETAKEERRSAYRPEELAQARGALIQWVIGIRKESTWSSLSTRARQAALEAHVAAAEDGFAAIDEEAVLAAKELAELLLELRAYRAHRVALERLADWTSAETGWREHNIWARHRLASVLDLLGDSEGAITCAGWLLQDIVLWEGDRSLGAVMVESALAEYLSGDGRPEDAMASLDSAMGRYDGVLPRGDALVRRTRRRRGQALVQLGRLREGLAEFRALLADMPDPGGADWVEAFNVRGLLAHALAESGRFEESIDEYRALVRESARTLGDSDPGTLVSRSDLARSLSGAGRADEALRELQDVIPRLEEVLGSDHRDILNCRNDLASCLRQLGRYAEAIEEDTRLLADRNRLYGPDHYATLRTRNNLAVALGDSGRHSEVIEELEAIVAARARLSGGDHPSSLLARGNLATAMAKAGRAEEAVVLMGPLLDDLDRVLGADHPRTIHACMHLATSYASLGRLEEAIAVVEPALRDARRVLGEAHPTTLDLRTSRAAFRCLAGEVAECLEDLDGIVADSISELGQDHPTTQAILAERDNIRQTVAAVRPPDERFGPILKKYSERAISAADAALEIQAMGIPGHDAPSASEVIVWAMMAGYGVPTPSIEGAEAEGSEILRRRSER